ncbi:hypothetical protein A2634_04635 [Candidatus Amesbacteria bacterium RIFCSPHIGHO2_01_FULL_48_32]|uniref:Uncharacterized protein n=1 Tax=Candidatus Amesbacteria bacterium RIFCSPLOWO2_01_FULL_48_25 TaxID=1797259 RepID=A0A1F4ZEG9_9BACT|nr:MAG: hypothetical protein A2634_04635 [Candidatus Amesbacteria bacterium RIFCSPHIGHO2_01_FULL_48_32]OGD03824.1 MAG: hypothetical protein A2989_04105 [Candidatus Amesbacteria bacterium RIFCSPLOWO2_01_FULL_48_25]HJZ05064.1 hypothetical protein [Patescibacteria group bacterium]
MDRKLFRIVINKEDPYSDPACELAEHFFLDHLLHLIATGQPMQLAQGLILALSEWEGECTYFTKSAGVQSALIVQGKGAGCIAWRDKILRILHSNPVIHVVSLTKFEEISRRANIDIHDQNNYIQLLAALLKALRISPDLTTMERNCDNFTKEHGHLYPPLSYPDTFKTLYKPIYQ